MKINENKFKIVYFRNVGKRATDFTFKNDPNIIATVSSYRAYIGLFFIIWYGSRNIM